MSLHTTQNRKSASTGPYKWTEYLKVPFTPQEMKILDIKLKRVSSFFKENDVLLNVPELLRVLSLNIDDPDFIQVLLKTYKNDASSIWSMK